MEKDSLQFVGLRFKGFGAWSLEFMDCSFQEALQSGGRRLSAFLRGVTILYTLLYFANLTIMYCTHTILCYTTRKHVLRLPCYLNVVPISPPPTPPPTHARTRPHTHSHTDRCQVSVGRFLPPVKPQELPGPTPSQGHLKGAHENQVTGCVCVIVATCCCASICVNVMTIVLLLLLLLLFMYHHGTQHHKHHNI